MTKPREEVFLERGVSAAEGPGPVRFSTWRDVGTLTQVVSGNGTRESQFGVGLRKSGSKGTGDCRSGRLIPETVL